MSSFSASLRAALRSPLLPYWLVIALLPFGRSAELGTALCLFGTVMLFLRFPHALQQHEGARCLLLILAAYIGAALISAVDAVAPGKSWGTVAGLLRFAPLGLYACFALRRVARVRMMYVAVAVVIALWALDAWVQALTGWSLGGHAEAERISGIFGADNPSSGRRWRCCRRSCCGRRASAGARGRCGWSHCCCSVPCCLPGRVRRGSATASWCWRLPGARRARSAASRCSAWVPRA